MTATDISGRVCHINIQIHHNTTRTMYAQTNMVSRSHNSSQFVRLDSHETFQPRLRSGPGSAFDLIPKKFYEIQHPLSGIESSSIPPPVQMWAGLELKPTALVDRNFTSQILKDLKVSYRHSRCVLSQLILQSVGTFSLQDRAPNYSNI